MKTILLSALLVVGAAAVLRADPVIKFDDLQTNNVNSAPVPIGYHLLGWTNFNYTDGLHNSQNPSGLSNGVVSANNAVTAGAGFPGAISGGLFDFLSANLTAAANDGLVFEAKGYIKGTLIYDQTNILSATSSTFIQFNFYGVDTVVLSSSGGVLHGGYSNLGAYFVMDNVSVTTYAPLPFIRNGGFETGDFTGWDRSGTTSSTLVSGGTYVHLGAFGAQMGPTNFGGLGQLISPTQIGQTYTVSFFLRNNSGGSNSFNVYWDGTDHPVGFTNQAAFTYTNFHFDVVATRPSENLTFQFLNVPSYFGFDDVSVTYPQFVTNGGFETGDFSGWTHFGVTNQDSVLNVGARTGTYTARFGAAGSPGFISQDLTTIPGQPYLVSAWLNSLVGLSVSNEFHLSWGGQPVANLTNLPPAGWTNVHFTAVSGNSENTLQFGLRDDPAYLLLDEISVIPTPLLQNGGFEFGDFTGWTTSGNFTFCSVSMDTTSANSGFYGGKFGPIGPLGFISQNVPTVPGQTYLIGFMLNTPAGTTNSEFRVSWNGAVLLDFTNFNLVGYLPYELAVTASGTNSSVQFGFRDDLAYLGLDDVYITPVPAPQFESIVKTNGNVNLSWSALPGYLYQLQYRTNLTQGNWGIARDLSFPTNFPMTVTDTNPPEPQRFYRVLLAPPPLIF